MSGNKARATWEDTIVALATAPGIGALGMIRLSGPKAIGIADRLFPGKDISSQPSHTLHVGLLKTGDEVLDQVVLSLFRAPHSFTGEDTIEISCHGSPYIQEAILAACVAQGARLALPGEYTQRAFLNGKMDLAQAEAVADLIAAGSRAAQQTALNQLRGGFSGDLRHLREQLINFAALIELELDFSEEDVQFANRAELTDLLEKINTAAKRLADSFRIGNVIKNGISVVIAGKPNAGKSTLLNALLNEDRAIVSDIAGTTRDTIEEVLHINGIAFRFTDTAGIRAHTLDAIEKIGIERTLQKINTSAILLYIADLQTEEPGAVIEEVKKLSQENDTKPAIVFNKADLLTRPALTELAAQIKQELGAEIPVFLIAANNEQKGVHTIDNLKNHLYKLAISEEINTENTIVTSARHYAALEKILESLNDIRTGMANNVTGDLLALDIRQSLHYLGEITGQIETDKDILGTIFGKFCIGK